MPLNANWGSVKDAKVFLLIEPTTTSRIRWTINLNAYENSKSVEDNSEPLQLSAQKAVNEYLSSIEADS